MEQEYPSQLLEKAVDALSSLPSIGRRTALRLSLHLLRQEPSKVENLANSITNLRFKVKYCSMCHNISDEAICSICSNSQRNSNIVCVVQNIQDVVAIENTRQYNGVYHVLGGIISPIDGIGPSDLQINSLIDRVESGEIQEIIIALSPTTDGETTSFYIARKLAKFNIKVTTIARGVSIGDELEYTDEITLGRSIANRITLQESK